MDQLTNPLNLEICHVEDRRRGGWGPLVAPLGPRLRLVPFMKGIGDNTGFADPAFRASSEPLGAQIRG